MINLPDTTGTFITNKLAEIHTQISLGENLISSMPKREFKDYRSAKSDLSEEIRLFAKDSSHATHRFEEEKRKVFSNQVPLEIMGLFAAKPGMVEIIDEMKKTPSHEAP